MKKVRSVIRISLLHMELGPAGPPGDPLELDHVLVALGGAEEEDGSVLLHVHPTGARFYLLSTE
jgi:hypothetical protein